MTDTPTPLVSVVIATYNMGAYLFLAIRSVLDQTYEKLEILVVDDGSTDDTAEIIRPFLEDTRIRYISQVNGGQASAKNRGIKESRGEFVAFLDADDIWAPSKIAEQLPLFFRSESVGVVFSQYIEIDAQGIPGKLVGSDFSRGKVSGPLLVFNFVGFSTSIVRKQCFDRLGYFREDLGMGIDYELWLRFSTDYEFDYVDRPLVYYRIWLGQMSKNYQRRYMNGIEIMKDFLSKHPDVVDKNTQHDAWAHTYSGLASCLHRSGEGIAPTLRQYLRALSFRPTYLPAWKGIIKVFLGVK
ncbi:MAG: glycosyltransferase [Candidatus Competibacter sp.]|nr:glycosyltransferase [Candidatus Competibacter sp.]MDG4583968.1 glycosyltransferase [Candidatus Competibacter sp.]